MKCGQNTQLHPAPEDADCGRYQSRFLAVMSGGASCGSGRAQLRGRAGLEGMALAGCDMARTRTVACAQPGVLQSSWGMARSGLPWLQEPSERSVICQR